MGLAERQYEDGVTDDVTIGELIEEGKKRDQERAAALNRLKEAARKEKVAGGYSDPGAQGVGGYNNGEEPSDAEAMEGGPSGTEAMDGKEGNKEEDEGVGDGSNETGDNEEPSGTEDGNGEKDGEDEDKEDEKDDEENNNDEDEEENEDQEKGEDGDGEKENEDGNEEEDGENDDEDKEGEDDDGEDRVSDRLKKEKEKAKKEEEEKKNNSEGEQGDDMKIEGIQDTAVKAINMATKSMLRFGWELIPPVLTAPFGCAIISFHVFMRWIGLKKYFCRLGEEWSMPGMEKKGPSSTLLKILEPMAFVFLLIMIIFSIFVGCAFFVLLLMAITGTAGKILSFMQSIVDVFRAFKKI